MPPNAHRLPRPADPETDERELREAVIGMTRDLRRWPVPDELLERYGADAATRRVERVYDELVASRRG